MFLFFIHFALIADTRFIVLTGPVPLAAPLRATRQRGVNNVLCV